MKNYRKNVGIIAWAEYRKKYRNLMRERENDTTETFNKVQPLASRIGPKFLCSKPFHVKYGCLNFCHKCI